MLNKLKKNNKKGFTLVELIVVLVILAILAALLIPALTGYIDKARDKQIIAETRQAVMAAQTLADEWYATNEAGDEVEFGSGKDIELTRVEKLAELPADSVKSAKVKADQLGTSGVDAGLYKVAVSTLEYENHGKKCTYTAEPATGAEKYVVSATP